MTRGPEGGPERGVVLVNVLVMLALSATVLTMMLNLGDLAIARSQRFGEAGQALALVRAGEQSAIVALRRDRETAPETDHPGEAWGAIAQQGIEIAGGSFALEIADAQDRFNLNAVKLGGLQANQLLVTITQALDLPPALAARIAETVLRDGPLRRIEELTWRTGMAPGDLVRLREFVTVLPGPGETNVNAASERLLAVLLQNPVQARALVSRRERAGFLTDADVTAASAILPPGVGFVSDHFLLRSSVRIGTTGQTMESLLQRRESAGGTPEVVVVDRRVPDPAALPGPRE